MDEKIILKSEKVKFRPYICIIISIVLIASGLIKYAVKPDAHARTLLDSMLDFRTSGTLIDIGLILLVVSAFIAWMLSSDEITITNMRVYGKSHFGKRVDLPIDMISAVGTSMLKGLTVATSSGVIKFALLENRDELHEAISKLLLERQSQQRQSAVIQQDNPPSNADELIKFKELLDSGIITQEEFDAKKKQLLGL